MYTMTEMLKSTNIKEIKNSYETKVYLFGVLFIIAKNLTLTGVQAVSELSMNGVAAHIFTMVDAVFSILTWIGAPLIGIMIAPIFFYKKTKVTAVRVNCSAKWFRACILILDTLMIVGAAGLTYLMVISPEVIAAFFGATFTFWPALLAFYLASAVCRLVFTLPFLRKLIAHTANASKFEV